MSGISGIQNGGLAAVDDSRRNTRANMDKAAQQFEAMFLTTMLKQARQAGPSGDLFKSDAMTTFREMRDRQIAGEMAKHSPLGIAKALRAFLERGPGIVSGGGE